MDIRQSLIRGVGWGSRVANMAEKKIKPVSNAWAKESLRRKDARTPEALKALAGARAAYAEKKHAADTAKKARMVARKGGGFPMGASRRAAAIGDRMARHNAAKARSDMLTAMAACPETLERRALQAHLVHSVPTMALAWGWPGLWWPAAASMALVAANVAVARLAGRVRASERFSLPEGLNREEAALCARLDPSWWVVNAEGRGLGETVPGRLVVTPGGIECAIRLDGKWTAAKLAAAEDSVRNLLGMRTSLRMRIVPGKTGQWANLQFATRSAATGSSAWSQGCMPDDAGLVSLGTDTETGDEVFLQFDERLLISGASGTGKSWSSRPLMAHAHLRGDLVFIDAKGEEANVWGSVCRCATEPDEIREAIREIHAEMHRRRKIMKDRSLSVWPGRQLTVVVDEGQVALAVLKLKKKGGKKRDEDDEPEYEEDLIQMLVELSSLGRSRGIVLWWATQKPIMSGAAPGVHNLIAPNLLQRFSLRVADQKEAQTALDDCAHYLPHKIPSERSYRGHGYLKDYGPRLIRTWTMDDESVKRLPRRVWQPGVAGVADPVAASAAPAVPVDLTKEDVAVAAMVSAQVVEPVAASAAPSVAAVAPTATPRPQTQREKVLTAVRDGARYAKDVALCTGCNKGNVSRELGRLIADGLVHRDSEGRLTAISSPA